MENVYNHASRPINGIGCALYQCVRVIPVPAWMLKLGISFAHSSQLEIHQERTNHQGDQGQPPMGPIMHVLSSAPARSVVLRNIPTLNRED